MSSLISLARPPYWRTLDERPFPLEQCLFSITAGAAAFIVRTSQYSVGLGAQAALFCVPTVTTQTSLCCVSSRSKYVAFASRALCLLDAWLCCARPSVAATYKTHLALQRQKASAEKEEGVETAQTARGDAADVGSNCPQMVCQAPPTPRSQAKKSSSTKEAADAGQPAWWQPPADMATLGKHYVSEFLYPGLNAPLAGMLTKAHKQLWAQPPFVPHRIVDTARSASHTRQKQFFSYRHDERPLAMAALAMSVKLPSKPTPDA
jgi:hypothetical protein